MSGRGTAEAFSCSIWFRAGLGLVSLALLPLLWTVLCTAASSSVPWNAARLAPSFALAYGLPLYALRESGGHLGWFYGPGLPLWNLPATWCSNPTPALGVAAVWNVLTWLAPVALILRAAGVARGRMLLAGAALAGVLLLGNRVSNYGLYFIHVDGLCLAAGVVACVALHRATREGRERWVVATAGALAVAFWTKQISCLLVLAMFIWLWREGHRRLIGRLAFWCVVGGAASSLAVCWFFGAEQVLFNVWLVHSRNPWRGDARLLLDELGHLLAAAWVWLPLLAVVAWFRRAHGPARLPAAAGSLARLLAWSALVQLPPGLAAVLKAGGGLNSLHAVHYLLLILLILAFASFARCPLRSQSWTVPGALWLAAVGVPLASALMFSTNPGSRWTLPDSHERLVDLARREPGRYYFPWNPLATLIAERRIQPMDDALYCLWLARLEPPVERIREAVPRDPIILYEEPAQSRFALRYFPAAKGVAP